MFCNYKNPRPKFNNINFYSDSLATLITTLKSQEGKNIFVDGGAEIVIELMKQNLIDDLLFQ